MARRENLIGSVVVATLGLAGFAAVRYGLLEKSRDMLNGHLASQLAIHLENNYSQGELDELRLSIPGPWKISNGICDLLAEHGSVWQSIALRDRSHLEGVPDPEFRKTRPNLALLKLTLMKEYGPPTGFARLMIGGSASEVTERFYLVSEKYLPPSDRLMQHD